MTDNDWAILAEYGVTPDNLTVRGGLHLVGTAITALPEGLTVLGNLDLYNTAITHLPDNLTVRGGLYLAGTAITHLPDNLTVRGGLYLAGTEITHLSDGLTVRGGLYLAGTAITGLYECERGYKLVRVGDVYHCGCRRFTAAEAIAHWTDPKYPNLKRGRAFADAVMAEEMRRKDED